MSTKIHKGGHKRAQTPSTAGVELQRRIEAEMAKNRQLLAEHPHLRAIPALGGPLNGPGQENQPQVVAVSPQYDTTTTTAMMVVQTQQNEAQLPPQLSVMPVPTSPQSPSSPTTTPSHSRKRGHKHRQTNTSPSDTPPSEVADPSSDAQQPDGTSISNGEKKVIAHHRGQHSADFWKRYNQKRPTIRISGEIKRKLIVYGRSTGETPQMIIDRVLNEYFTKEQMKEDGTIVPMTTIVTTPMVDDHHPEQPGMDSQQQAMHQDSTM